MTILTKYLWIRIAFIARDLALSESFSEEGSLRLLIPSMVPFIDPSYWLRVVIASSGGGANTTRSLRSGLRRTTILLVDRTETLVLSGPAVGGTM